MTKMRMIEDLKISKYHKDHKVHKILKDNKKFRESFRYQFTAIQLIMPI